MIYSSHDMVSDLFLPAPGLLGAEAAKNLRRYVLEREKEGGGFALTPGLPATVEDTYYAVRILELLGKDEAMNRTRSYLDRLDWGISRRAKIIYALLYLRRKFACPQVCPYSFSAKIARVLEEAYYWQKIARMWGNDPVCQTRFDFDLSTLALPANPTIRDLRYYLALKADRLPPPEVVHWSRWAQACQSPAGGFGFKPGTTAFMDNILPALEILRQLGHAPLHGQKLIDFILACQTRAGGFARTSGGVPFLESSFQAVKSLYLLNRLLGKGVDNQNHPAPG